MRLPDDFLHETRALLGDERYRLFLAGTDREATVSIRLNPLKMRKDWRYTVPDNAGKVPWCRGGWYLKARPDFTFDPLLHAGVYYVQDAASMFLDTVLRQEVTEPVTLLDLCAAPGGKTTLTAAAIPEGSRIYANEAVGKRARILAENCWKAGLKNTVVTNAFARDYAREGLLFDVIVADVPCSGEGMFRKDEEAVRQWSPEKVRQCAALQREIISDIWPCLRPGGLLVYSTCTINAQENEDNCAFIVRELGAEGVGIAVEDDWHITPALKGDLPACRFIPGITAGEGLFVCALRKNKDGECLRPKKNNKAPTRLTDLMPPPLQEAPRVELTCPQALAYLRHESLCLDEEAPRGILTVTFQGHALGQVKNIGNRANNLYPKEWRIRTTHTPERRPDVVHMEKEQ